MIKSDKMNINNQKLIYFYSPMGIWTRINKNTKRNEK